MTASTRPESRDRLDGLQALRAIAALAVVVFHAGRYVADRVPEAAWRWGEFGVDVFFVLSGFVMLWATRPGTSASMFLARRVARIAPMYWLATVLVAVTLWLRPSLFHSAVLDPVHLIECLAFIPHFNPGAPDKVWPLFVPGWTLNYEMYFYLVFAATLPWIAKSGARILVISGVLGLGAVLARSIEPPTPASAVFLAQPLVFEFVLGMAVAWVLQTGARLRPIMAALLAAAAFTLLVANADDDTRLLTAGVPAAALVLAMASFARLRSWLGRAVMQLGDASYTLYLIHPYLVGAVWLAWRGSAPDTHSVGAAGFIGACLMACIGAAMPIHRWIERPITRAVTRWLVGPSRQRVD